MPSAIRLALPVAVALSIGAAVLRSFVWAPDVSADRKPLPREKTFDTGGGFNDVRAFCDGHVRVYVGSEDYQATSSVAVVKDSELCP